MYSTAYSTAVRIKRYQYAFVFGILNDLIEFFFFFFYFIIIFFFPPRPAVTFDSSYRSLPVFLVVVLLDVAYYTPSSASKGVQLFFPSV